MTARPPNGMKAPSSVSLLARGASFAAITHAVGRARDLSVRYGLLVVTIALIVFFALLLPSTFQSSGAKLS